MMAVLCSNKRVLLLSAFYHEYVNAYITAVQRQQKYGTLAGGTTVVKQQATLLSGCSAEA
jgi:hypothetical protein